MEKGSGIFPDPDPVDTKRPDPTGSGSATLKITFSDVCGHIWTLLIIK